MVMLKLKVFKQRLSNWLAVRFTLEVVLTETVKSLEYVFIFWNCQYDSFLWIVKYALRWHTSNSWYPIPVTPPSQPGISNIWNDNEARITQSLSKRKRSATSSNYSLKIISGRWLLRSNHARISCYFCRLIILQVVHRLRIRWSKGALGNEKKMPLVFMLLHF